MPGIRKITRPDIPRSTAPKTYPHVAEIGDYPTQQSIRLLWDLLKGMQADVAAAQATITSQASTITDLRASLAGTASMAQQALAAAGKPTQQAVVQPSGPLPPEAPVGGFPDPPVIYPGVTDAIDAASITWVGLNVSAWPITAAITSVGITASQVCLDYTGKNTWPAVDPDGSGIPSPGNPWVFAEIAGTWYGSTYEWLRVGQVCKNVTAAEFQLLVTGTSPLDSWTPSLGETVGFMVSSLARNGPQSPIPQRTQIVTTVWPY